MDYASLFTTAFKTARKAPLAWLFSLCYVAYALLNTLPRSLELLVCPQLLLVWFITLVGVLGIALSLYHAYFDQPANMRETWAEIRYWLRPFTLFMIVWGLIIVIPWFAAFVALRSRMSYVLLVMLLGLILNTFVFQIQYALLGMIRQRGASRLFRHAWKVWSYEHPAKLLIATLTIVVLAVPRTLLVVAAYPGTSLLAITSTQYSLQAFPWLHLLVFVWEWLLAPIFWAMALTLYMHIIHEHPELDLAKSATSVSSTDRGIAPTTPAAN